MAPTTLASLVEHSRVALPEGATIMVDTPEWYAWLADARSFTFRSEHGTFTAQKERRGIAREYWKAYRRRAGRLKRIYLGKSAELTLERLNAVAVELAGAEAAAAAQPVAAGRRPNAQRKAAHALPVYSPPASAIAPDDARSLHLLATKLALPAPRPNLVPRQRLAEQFDTAIAYRQKLILISAPAGFGKTTALVEWLTSRQYRPSDLRAAVRPAGGEHLNVAWLALDDADNQLGQFLAYLIAALETIRPGGGADAWALLRTEVAQPPARAILTVLMNQVANYVDRIVLALDDYHTITLQTIHEAVAFLLDRMPAHMHVIMTTRADPPLPLARLRVRGQFTEVRAADLRFTPDEAAGLFDQFHGVQLSSDAVTALETYTEGWAAGLQLAALSLRSQNPAEIATFIADFTSGHQYVFDYLADEVFQRQPEDVQAFLIRSAVLSRLSGPLCAAVTGQDEAQAMLERLDHANLFLVPLDNQRRWYRYQHLFRDFLCERLTRAIGASGLAMLHRRASAWFEQQGLAGEAIDHALSAKEWADATRCLAPLLASQQFYDYYLDWPRWLAALPDTVLRTNPVFCLRSAWVLLLTGHIEAAERPLRLAEELWHAAGNRPKLGEVVSTRSLACYFKGDFTGAILLAEQALEMLPADATEQRGIATYVLGVSYLFHGNVQTAEKTLAAAYTAFEHSSEVFFALVTCFGLAHASHLRGKLQYAATLYQDVSDRAGDVTYQQVAVSQIYLGKLFYEWNDLAAAERALREGVAIGQRTGRDRYYPQAYGMLARVLWARSDLAQAGAMAERAREAAELLNSPRDIAEAQALQAWLWLEQGDLAASQGWLAARSLAASDTASYQRQAEYIMLAYIQLAQERQMPGSVDLEAVVQLLERLRQIAEDDTRLPDQIAALALLALVRTAQGQATKALATLAKALALAAPEGYIRTFVDSGPPMHALIAAYKAQLAQAPPSPTGQAQEHVRPYIELLLEAFPRKFLANPTTSIARLLSERERAILQLLAGGQSIQLIATHLVISAHTVRTHVKHIYAKLEVHNRLQAVEHARALNLL